MGDEKAARRIGSRVLLAQTVKNGSGVWVVCLAAAISSGTSAASHGGQSHLNASKSQAVAAILVTAGHQEAAGRQRWHARLVEVPRKQYKHRRAPQLPSRSQERCSSPPCRPCGELSSPTALSVLDSEASQPQPAASNCARQGRGGAAGEAGMRG